MAEIVSVMAMAHAPGVTGWLDSAPVEEQVAIKAGYEEMGELLRKTKPDVLVGIANDHMLNLPLKNPPDFTVGNAAHWEGPAEFFKPWLAQEGYEVAGRPDIADCLTKAGEAAGLKLNSRDDLLFDDNWSIPLFYLTPDYSIPLVPIHMNCINPPVPSPEESVRAGQVLAETIKNGLPDDLRVAVFATGGLSHEPGGPRYFTLDADFDRWFMDLLAEGDVDKMLKEATIERMNAAGGGGTTELLAWMVAMAVAGGTPARSIFYVGSAEMRCGIGGSVWDAIH
jgi:aromatic ring-opening dioxygenase catalytic subunit (LigB family)